jgi:hypothetical protein
MFSSSFTMSEQQHRQWTPYKHAAPDTVESGQPFLLRGTPGLTARNARASRRALDETAQGRSTRQDREAVRQSAEREAPLPAQMCRRRTGSEEHERLPHSLSGAMKRKSGKSGIEARRQTGTVRHRSL